MFMKLLNVCASVMLSASCVNGLSSLVHKSLKQIDKQNLVITDYDYTLSLSAPYSSFIYPLYSTEGDLLSPYYSSFDMNYSCIHDTAFYNNGAVVTYNNIDYQKFCRLSYQSTNYYYFLISKYYVLDNSLENFYSNLVLINSNIFSTLSYQRFYITWDYCFIRYVDNPYNVLISSFNIPYEYRGDSLTIDDVSYYVFRNYSYTSLVSAVNVSLDSIYNSDDDYIFYSRVHVSYNTTSSYGDGYNDGYNVGYGEGKSTGYTSGYNTGYTAGQNASSASRNLFLSIADTPMLMLRSLFNFDFFGVNFFIIVVGLLTMLLIIYLVKKFI